MPCGFSHYAHILIMEIMEILGSFFYYVELIPSYGDSYDIDYLVYAPCHEG